MLDTTNENVIRNGQLPQRKTRAKRGSRKRKHAPQKARHNHKTRKKGEKKRAPRNAKRKPKTFRRARKKPTVYPKRFSRAPSWKAKAIGNAIAMSIPPRAADQSGLVFSVSREFSVQGSKTR